MYISFATDSAAFEDDAVEETKRILRRIAEEQGRKDYGVIFDLNGNKIGEWTL
jgi:hypothetical protein